MRVNERASLLVMAIGITAVDVTQAGLIDLPEGAQFTVHGGDPVHDYNLTTSRLIIKDGGETGRIVANSDAWVDMDGGKVTSAGTHAIELINSSAVIDNSSIIAVADPTDPTISAFGIQMSGYEKAPSAVVSNSFVSGIDRGINATNESSLVLANTRVEGYAGSSGAGFVTGGAGIVISGSSAHVTQGSHVQGENNGVVLWSQAIGTKETSAVLVVDQSSVVGLDGSAVVMTKSGYDTDVYVDVRNGSTLSGGNGVILSAEQGVSGHFNVDDSRLTGNVAVEDGSTLNISLQNNASLTGNITSATALSIDQSSLWKMEGDSTVGALALNGGTVDLRGTTSSFHRLSLGELSGNGTFALGTSLSTGERDFLEVSGTATGQHKLLITNSGVDPLKGSGDLQVVHAGQGDAQFSLIGDRVDFGTFAYRLQQDQNVTGGTDWSLVQTDELSDSARSVVGLFSAAPTVWYGESASLRSRMGELRNGNSDGGGWVRSYGNKYNMSAGGGVAYTQNQQGISLGADGPMSTSNGQWLVGVMTGYSKSDLNLQAGTSGKVDSYYLGAYSTWLADDGFYVDALIKANRFQNASDVRMGDGQKAKGEYNSYGVGASVEAGKHIKLEDQWFIEPFAQVSGLLVGGEKYGLDNGMRAKSNKADSLLGKVGSQLGRDFALADGGFVQPYVKVALAHEFASGNRVTINDNRFTNDLSGTRGELGVGIAAQLTSTLQVHADLDYMKGKNIEQPMGVNLGLRYNW